MYALNYYTIIHYSLNSLFYVILLLLPLMSVKHKNLFPSPGRRYFFTVNSCLNSVQSPSDLHPSVQKIVYRHGVPFRVTSVNILFSFESFRWEYTLTLLIKRTVQLIWTTSTFLWFTIIGGEMGTVLIERGVTHLKNKVRCFTLF